jgi:hypothetical protein
MIIYAIRINERIDSYYATLTLAQTALKKLYRDRCSRMGVNSQGLKPFDYNPMYFSFTLGWEEIEVTFRIVNVEVNE